MYSVDSFLKKIKPFKMGHEKFKDLVNMGLLSGMVRPIGSFFLDVNGDWGYGKVVCGNTEIPRLLPERCVSGKELWDLTCRMLVKRKTLLCYKNSGEIFEINSAVMKEIYVFFTGNAKHPFRDRVVSRSEEYLGSWPYWFDEVKGVRLPKSKTYFAEYIRGRAIVPVTEDYYYGRPVAYELATLRENKIFSLGFVTKDECDFPDKFLRNPEIYAMKPCKMKAMEIIPALHKVRYLKFVSVSNKKLSDVCDFDELFDY